MKWVRVFVKEYFLMDAMAFNSFRNTEKEDNDDDDDEDTTSNYNRAEPSTTNKQVNVLVMRSDHIW